MFSTKTTKQKAKRKWTVWVKAWLENCMYTSAFSNTFAGLMVNDNQEFTKNDFMFDFSVT